MGGKVDLKGNSLKGNEIFWACASGIALALSFPPFKFGFISYVAFIPLLRLLLPERGLRGDFLLGFIWGLAFNSATIYWIAWITLPGMISAVLILSLYPGIFMIAMRPVVRRFGRKGLCVSPFMWVAVEYLRSFGDLGFPWTAVGNSQTYYTYLIQFASFTGVYGVSAWVIALNLALFEAVGGRRYLAGAASAAVLVILAYAYGRAVVPRVSCNGDVRVALIQGNLLPEEKWGKDGLELSFNIYSEMTEEVASDSVDLVIWPETAIPAYLMRFPQYRDFVQGIADSLDVPILTGAPDYDPYTDKSYNSAFLFIPGSRTHQGYNKIQLVPLSERIPFRDIFPALGRLKFAGGGFSTADFSKGKDYTVFKFPGGSFSVLICFESVFPSLVREFVRAGADFLVVITNDSWFGPTSSPYQHAQIAVFRAIENRVGLARCANTGISMIVDPYGRVVGRTPIFSRTALVGSVAKRREVSFYTRHGDLFSQMAVILSLVFVAVALFTRKG